MSCIGGIDTLVQNLFEVDGVDSRGQSTFEVRKCYV